MPCGVSSKAFIVCMVTEASRFTDIVIYLVAFLLLRFVKLDTATSERPFPSCALDVCSKLISLGSLKPEVVRCTYKQVLTITTPFLSHTSKYAYCMGNGLP